MIEGGSQQWYHIAHFIDNGKDLVEVEFTDQDTHDQNPSNHDYNLSLGESTTFSFAIEI